MTKNENIQSFINSLGNYQKTEQWICGHSRPKEEIYPDRLAEELRKIKLQADKILV